MKNLDYPYPRVHTYTWISPIQGYVPLDKPYPRLGSHYCSSRRRSASDQFECEKIKFFFNYFGKNGRYHTKFQGDEWKIKSGGQIFVILNFFLFWKLKRWLSVHSARVEGRWYFLEPVLSLIGQNCPDVKMEYMQCFGSVSFWCGSASGMMDPDPT